MTGHSPSRMRDRGAAMVLVLMLMVILSITMIAVGGLVITYFNAANLSTDFEDATFDGDESLQRTLAALLNITNPGSPFPLELPPGACDTGDYNTFTIPLKDSVFAAFDVDNEGGEDKEDLASGHKDWVRIDCVELDENPIAPLPVIDQSIVLFSQEPEAFSKAGAEPVRLGQSIRVNAGSATSPSHAICLRKLVPNALLDYELEDGCLDPTDPAEVDDARAVGDVIFVSDDASYPQVVTPGSYPPIVNRSLPWDPTYNPNTGLPQGDAPIGIQARRRDADGAEIHVNLNDPASDPTSELENVWPGVSTEPYRSWDPYDPAQLQWSTDYVTGDPAAPFKMPQNIADSATGLDPPVDLPRIDKSTCRLVTAPGSSLRVNDVSPADLNKNHRIAGFQANTTPIWDCVRRWKPGNYAYVDVDGPDADHDGIPEDTDLNGVPDGNGTPGQSSDFRPFLYAWQDWFGIDWEDDGTVDVPGSWEPDLGLDPINPLCPGGKGFMWLFICFNSQQWYGPHARIHIRANVFEPGVYYFADNLAVDAAAYEDKVIYYLQGPFLTECTAQTGSVGLCQWVVGFLYGYVDYLSGKDYWCCSGPLNGKPIHPPIKKTFHAPLIAGTPNPDGGNPAQWDPNTCQEDQPGTMFVFAPGKGLHQGADQVNPPADVILCALTQEQVDDPAGTSGPGLAPTLAATATGTDQSFGGDPSSGFAPGSITRDVALFQLPFPLAFWNNPLELNGNPPTDPLYDTAGWSLHAARNTLHGGALSLDGIVYSPHGRVGVSSTYLANNAISVGSGVVAHSLLIISRFPGNVFSEGLPEAVRRIRFFVKTCDAGDLDCPVESQVIDPLDPNPPDAIPDTEFLFDDTNVLPGDALPPSPEFPPPLLALNFPMMRDPDFVADVATMTNNTARVERWIRGNPTE